MATRDLRQIEPLMGRDLRLDYRQSGGFFEDADLATVRSQRSAHRERDLATLEGLANLEQAIANRLKTRKGELAALGHPDYGSRHHELMGEPNVERTRDLIKIYVLQALRDEPRIERVLSAIGPLRACPAARHGAHRTQVESHRRAGAAESGGPVLAGGVGMSYAAEPYAQFVDDLLTSLTGGIVRQQFQFLDEAEAVSPERSGRDYSRHRAGVRTGWRGVPPLPEGRDYKLETDLTITWLADDQGAPAAGAVWPDEGTAFYANFEVQVEAGAAPPLTDRNPGSIVRLLAESFAREYAVLSRQLEAVYQAAFLDTAKGRDLEQLCALVGVARRQTTFAGGAAVFSRSSPAPADILSPRGRACPPPSRRP